MLLTCVLLGGCVEATTYTPLPPSVPRLRLPQNDAYQGSVHTGALRPRFVWSASTTNTSGTVSYELQYSADATFALSVGEVRTEDTSHQPDVALAVSMVPPVGQRYYWRVRACVAKSCSAYSPTWWMNLGRSNKDYNGDGHADLAVGAPFLNGGRVYVYFGGLGQVFDTVPDATLAQATATWFGYSLASIGDANGDGFTDLLVGAPQENDLAGAAYLYLGGLGGVSGTPDAYFRGLRANGDFGGAVAATGDVNGDGLSDFAIGASRDNFEGTNSGTVSIYLGAKSGAFKVGPTIVSTFNDGVGKTLASAGDLNGDGFADLAAGALGEMNFGSVYVYLGGPVFDVIPDLKVPGNVSQDFEGASLVSADFNEDGFSDLVVGVPAYMADMKTGHVYLYAGGESLDRNPDLTFEGQSISDKLGYSVSAGDLNGDGYKDLVFGAVSTSGLGRTEIHFGQPNELVSLTDGGPLRGRTTMDLYGASVSAGGDFNGDGLDDVVVGARGAGHAYVHFGNAGTPFELSPDGVIDGIPSSAGIGHAIANP
jgi:hypothetical protein